MPDYGWSVIRTCYETGGAKSTAFECLNVCLQRDDASKLTVPQPRQGSAGYGQASKAKLDGLVYRTPYFSTIISSANRTFTDLLLVLWIATERIATRQTTPRPVVTATKK